VNGVKLANILFLLLCFCVSVCMWALSPIGLNGRNDVLFAEKCIRLVCEKLTLFPYGQDIVGNVVLLAFWWYTCSQVQGRSVGFREMYKNVTLISRKMELPQHAVQRWRHGIGQQRDHSFVIIVLQIHLADICTFWAPSSFVQGLTATVTLNVFETTTLWRCIFFYFCTSQNCSIITPWIRMLSCLWCMNASYSNWWTIKPCQLK